MVIARNLIKEALQLDHLMKYIPQETQCDYAAEATAGA
jgi:hypothetical protein